MSGAGVSGPAVALAGGGALLIYAGLTKRTPLDALRAVARGQVLPIGAPAGGVAREVAGSLEGANAAEHRLGAADEPGRPVGELLAGAALKYVGRPYTTGGTGNPGFDCSGLVQRAFRDIGITDCPRTTGQQIAWRRLVRRPTGYVPTVGDLVFWPGHVVIALGSGRCVGAQNPRRGVIETDLATAGVPGTSIMADLWYAAGTD